MIRIETGSRLYFKKHQLKDFRFLRRSFYILLLIYGRGVVAVYGYYGVKGGIHL